MYPLFLSFALSVSSQTTSTLEVDVVGLRNTRGFLEACLTQDRARFPDCSSDPHAVSATVQASLGRLIFSGVAPGEYAVLLFHDQNANRRLDTLLGIPREGFGFSRNPIVRFGAPRYDKVNIQLAPGFTRISVKLQYLL